MGNAIDPTPRNAAAAPPSSASTARSTPHATQSTAEPSDSPESQQEQAAAAIDDLRVRTPRRRQAFQLQRPSLTLPRAGSPTLEFPRAPTPAEVAEASQPNPFFEDVEPAERQSLISGIADALADDTVDKLDAIVDRFNRIRTRRNGRREARGAEPRDLVEIDREGIRGMLEEGIEAGLEYGLKKALEKVLSLLLGEPIELDRDVGPFDLPESPPSFERLHEAERRLVLTTPEISF